MNIEKTTFGPWDDAYKLTLGDQVMVVLASVGPRIISFGLAGGPNLLFVDETGNLKRDDWHIYGGHRLWISPETEACYAPDNDPCAVEQLEEEIDGETFPVLRVTGGVQADGLQKSIEIGVNPTLNTFEVRHVVENKGPMLASGALWALTCMEPKGRVVVPWGEGSAGWRTQMVRYWKNWAGHGSDIESTQWNPRNGYFLVEPTGEEGKVGLFSDHQTMVFLREDCTFLKSAEFVDWPEDVTYPDGGCNLEIYTGTFFIELETLSPVRVFMPGEKYEHLELWKVTPKTYAPEDWEKLEEILA